MAVGKVYLVGAGPGDPGLITVRGLECLRAGDVVIADYLVNPLILAHARPDAEVIVRPKRREGGFGNQEEINRFLVERAQKGQLVVRLKGGDPFVFGRGGEEAEALVAAHVPFEVVPGVTAAIAAPAYAGIPITHRGLSGVVAFATGHETDDKESGAVDWDAVARGAGTLVLYMSVKRLPEVVARLRAAGRPADEPVAVVEQGTLPQQRVIVATLGDVMEKAADVQPPALTIVGPVVAMRDQLAWFGRRPRVLLLSTKEEGEALRLDLDVTRVSPLTVVPRFAEVKTALLDLERFRAIAFASAHAVEALLGALIASGRDTRALAGIRLCAVGDATARRLADAHLRADLVARGGGAELAQEMIAAQVPPPILLPRAAGGREELADGLRAAGLAVEVLDAYDTITDGVALRDPVRAHRQRPFDAIAFASPKGVAAFLDVAGGVKALGAARIGAIGDTTRAALEAAGARVDAVPETPSIAALLDSLAATLKIE